MHGDLEIPCFHFTVNLFCPNCITYEKIETKIDIIRNCLKVMLLLIEAGAELVKHGDLEIPCFISIKIQCKKFAAGFETKI